jgi:carbon starvation protein
MAILATVLCLAAYMIGYRWYAKYLARNVFSLDPNAVTPAVALADGIDYVPTNRYVLFGHHWASITGLSPMLGPAIAVIWGWLPAMLWVVAGALLVGCVHDFSALVLSLRARGKSIGKVTEGIIGPRAKSLFHAIIFFGVSLAMGVFVYVVALLFTEPFYPEAVFPSFALMVIAVSMGFALNRRGYSLAPVTLVGFVAMLGAVAIGLEWPVLGIGRNSWSIALLGYSFAASVLPVWILLQPRDWINSLLLYLGLGLMYAGFFWLQPEFAAPAVQIAPEGAPGIFPFVFIIIACGAASGFHGLVSSGTTAKQIRSESDARFIGYGGMIGESLLGLMAVLACTAGFTSLSDWQEHYGTWNQSQGLGNGINAFVQGTARFVASLGVPQEIAATFIAVVVVSFALTTLDSATRLLRYNIEEIGESLRLPGLSKNRYLASLLAVLSIAFFAFYEVGGKPAGLALWELFGTTNQLLAGLTLLVTTLYLMQRGRNFWVTLIPMLFMLLSTLVAMTAKLRDFWAVGDGPLFGVGLTLLILAVWLVVEAVLCFRRQGGARVSVEGLSIGAAPGED